MQTAFNIKSLLGTLALAAAGIVSAHQTVPIFGQVDFSAPAFAAAMKGVTLSVKENPGILMDVSFDQNGDIDRESYMTKVENGKQVISAILPPISRK